MKLPEIKLPERVRQFLSKEPNEFDQLARWYYRHFCRIAGREGEALEAAAILAALLSFPAALLAGLLLIFAGMLSFVLLLKFIFS